MVAKVVDRNGDVGNYRNSYNKQLAFMFDQLQQELDDEQINFFINAIAGWCMTMLRIGYIDTKQMVAINDMAMNNIELDLEKLGL